MGIEVRTITEVGSGEGEKESDLWVMDKGAIPAVWWQITGGGVLQTLDDCGLAGPVVTDDKGKWRVKTDCLTMIWRKGSDALNGQSVDARHGVNDVTRVTTVCDGEDEEGK